MQRFLEHAEKVWTEALRIWSDGGWGMVAIGAIALVMFGVGMGIRLRLGAKGFRRVPERVWRRWVHHPEEREGPVGRLLDFVDGSGTVHEVSEAFEHLRQTEITPFERDLKVMKVCVGTAPLVGLLGTVTGMLATFGALAAGSGGEKTMTMVSAGISEALITTETGLVVALPGLFFQYQLARGIERYKTFLAHLETVYAQILYRDIREEEHEALAVDLAPADRPRLRRILLERLRRAAARRAAAHA